MEETLRQLLPESAEAHAGLIAGAIVALLIFIVGWIASKWAARLVHRALAKKGVDEALSRFLGSIAQYTVLIAVVIAALEKVGISATSLTAIFASAGLAVGLALQGSLGNFAAGVMILFFRPFGLGDKIKAGGETGVVEDIGLFATTLVTAANETIIVGNSAIIGGTITNFTKRGTLRGSVSVGVNYGADVDAVMKVLEGAAKRAELTLDDPAPAVAFSELADSSLGFTVLASAKCADYLGMLHNVRRAVYEDLNAAGIDIPFNQIVVHNAAA